MTQKLGAKKAALFLLFVFSSLFFLGKLGLSSTVQERNLTDSKTESQPSASSETKPEQKGGIYAVGRAFKKAGSAIESGAIITGRAFKKAGVAVKNAFVGKKSSPETQGSLDHVGEEPESRAQGTSASK